MAFPRPRNFIEPMKHLCLGVNGFRSRRYGFQNLGEPWTSEPWAQHSGAKVALKNWRLEIVPTEFQFEGWSNFSTRSSRFSDRVSRYKQVATMQLQLYSEHLITFFSPLQSTFETPLAGQSLDSTAALIWSTISWTFLNQPQHAVQHGGHLQGLSELWNIDSHQVWY